jgi:aminocarboxymuconate-semialdehyde decarboxylase
MYFDSCVHDDAALRYLLEVAGTDRVMLGTDYPFPLGEQEPGSGIEALGLDDTSRARLFHGTALEWLGIPLSRFQTMSAVA